MWWKILGAICHDIDVPQAPAPLSFSEIPLRAFSLIAENRAYFTLRVILGNSAHSGEMEKEQEAGKNKNF